MSSSTFIYLSALCLLWLKNKVANWLQTDTRHARPSRGCLESSCVRRHLMTFPGCSQVDILGDLQERSWKTLVGPGVFVSRAASFPLAPSIAAENIHTAPPGPSAVKISNFKIVLKGGKSIHPYKFKAMGSDNCWKCKGEKWKHLVCLFSCKASKALQMTSYLKIHLGKTLQIFTVTIWHKAIILLLAERSGATGRVWLDTNRKLLPFCGQHFLTKTSNQRHQNL